MTSRFAKNYIQISKRGKKMANEYFESIKRGLEQAVNYANGNKSVGKSRIVTIPDTPTYAKTDIKQTREELGLTQNNFALVLGVSTKTVEAWESGRNIPQGSSQRLIDILKKGGRSFMQEYGLLTVCETSPAYKENFLK